MKQIKDLLSREMSRQEFLKFMGVGVMSVFGAGNLLAFLLSRQVDTKVATTTQNVEKGFGSSKFGI